MNLKMTFLAIPIALGLSAGAAMADQPKSYQITLSSASKVGTANLQAGEYKLVVDSPKVRFIESRTGKAIETEAKIESLDRKIEHTSISTNQVDGAPRISEIRIGGTKTKIVFP